MVEEEKRLMSGTKNLENKDDFWITISQQLANRDAPIITPNENPYIIDQELSKQKPKEIIEIINEK